MYACLVQQKTFGNANRTRTIFPINAHQNVNQKPIGSTPAYRAQCTLPPQPIYQTLLFDGSETTCMAAIFGLGGTIILLWIVWGDGF